LTPIIVGDLHAQVDNLLKILSENAFMEGLKRGEAALIFLGDAVHPELPGQYDYMDSSVLIMDLILRLKLRFPRQVFFVIGNHDSFSADVMKAGVAQSLLWEQRLVAMRGAAYRNEMATFYQLSPLLVVSPDFIACHAAPTRSKVNLEMLVEIRRYPALVHEVTWNRGKAPGYPAGYTQGDVKRFRNSLGVKEDKPFIVGHFPRSATETVWLDVGEIRQHHVIYSARPEQVGIFTRIDGEMVAQVYPSEPLQAWLNTRACTSVELEAPAGAS
jgi:hypothetical protein